MHAAKPIALVIDDDPDMAALVRSILEREGYAVEIARDGRSAQTFFGNLAPPALVTLDIMLPYYDGLELLAMLRSRAGWERVPVLMLTAKPKDKDRALAAGATDYLVKPFMPADLRVKIRELCPDPDD